jgi:hypothetical protein
MLMKMNKITQPPVGADDAHSHTTPATRRGRLIAPSTVTLSGSEGSLARGREMLRGVDTEWSACAQQDRDFTPMGAHRRFIGHHPDARIE